MKRLFGIMLIICMLFCMVACKNDDAAISNSDYCSMLGHKYKAATCIEPEICKFCGATSGIFGDHVYVAGECTVCKDYDESYCPKLYFTGNMISMHEKKDVREITFEYRSKEQIVTGAAKIKVQGTSSLAYTKKNYTINFYETSDFTQKMGVNVGWGAQTEYCLKANWIDKTHARNVASAKLVGEMQEKYGLFQMAPNNGAIDGFPVEVYINGEFHGLYTMNIPKDAWMFGMDENNPDHIVMCAENWSDVARLKEIPTDFSDWSVEVGPENDETLKKFQRLVRFVRDSSDEEFKANFSQYLDLDATINYYIMMNVGYMQDNVVKNMLLATYDGNVWYPTLYDMDTTWGTYFDGSKLYDYQNILMASGGSNALWGRMEKLYKEEIAARYFELRATVLSKNHIMEVFNNFYNSIPQEVLDRETEKWNTTETPIPGYPISQIEEYLDSVLPRLDAKFSEWQ